MSATCGDGKFEFIHCTTTRNMYVDAHKAISTCELWDWMARFNPGHGGFMFGENPRELQRINEIIDNGPIGHSGSSYGITMRNMQYIAKYGYNRFREEVIANRG
jgi:hypothetical protein